MPPRLVEIWWRNGIGGTPPEEKLFPNFRQSHPYPTPAGLVAILLKKFPSKQKAYNWKLIIICFSSQRAEGLPGEGEGGAFGEGGVDEPGWGGGDSSHGEGDESQGDICRFWQHILLENDESESSRLIMLSIAGSHIQLGLRHV